MIGFYIRENDIQWIRKLCNKLGQSNVNPHHPDLVMWRCIRELNDRYERIMADIANLQKENQLLKQEVRDAQQNAARAAQQKSRN